MDFNVEVPINSLSFGHVSFCLLQEFHKRGLTPNIFLTGNNKDLSAYKVEKDFEEWLNSCISKAYKSYSKNFPEFRLWHLFSAERNVSNKIVLLSFVEVDRLTDFEINVAKNQDILLFTSQYTIDICKKAGLNNVRFLPLGFDSTHFHKIDKQFLSKEITVFGLYGKLEILRKRHKKIIQAWIKKYGGNKNFALHLSITNPFLNQEQHNQLLNDIFEHKRPPYNINILPFCQTLESYNTTLNAANIVIGLGTESFGIPEFSSVALGKFGIIGKYAGYLSWANENNVIFVNPAKDMIEAHDGIFFNRNLEYNQGNLFDFNEDEFISACEKAVELHRIKGVNEEGLRLQEDFKWEKTADMIIGCLKEIS